MSTVVAHIEAVTQPSMLVAVNELQVLQNEKQICVENSLQFGQRLDNVPFRIGLEPSGRLRGHFFSSPAELVKANFFNFAMHACDRGAPPEDDAASQRLH